MSSGGEGWWKWGRGSWTEFEKWWVGNIGGVFKKQRGYDPFTKKA